MIVVADTGPLIALSKIGQLPLLQRLFGTVFIPLAVRDELVLQGRATWMRDSRGGLGTSEWGRGRNCRSFAEGTT